MKTRLSIAAVAVAAIAGFCGGLVFSGTPLRAQAKTPTEPKATAEEFKSHVVHQTDLPETELVPGSHSRLLASEESMLSFLTMEKNSYFAPHQHKQEQVMIVLDGTCDEIIEGKLYHVGPGDVIVLPSNIVHGAYINGQDVHAIDVFGSPRSDYMIKAYQRMIELNKGKK
jgi:quercetin dioxygenase-like cupin family protein